MRIGSKDKPSKAEWEQAEIGIIADYVAVGFGLHFFVMFLILITAITSLWVWESWDIGKILKIVKYLLIVLVPFGVACPLLAIFVNHCTGGVVEAIRDTAEDVIEIVTEWLAQKYAETPLWAYTIYTLTGIAFGAFVFVNFAVESGFVESLDEKSRIIFAWMVVAVSLIDIGLMILTFIGQRVCGNIVHVVLDDPKR